MSCKYCYHTTFLKTPSGDEAGPYCCACCQTPFVSSSGNVSSSGSSSQDKFEQINYTPSSINTKTQREVDDFFKIPGTIIQQEVPQVVPQQVVPRRVPQQVSSVTKIYILADLTGPNRNKIVAISNKVGSTRPSNPHTTLFEIVVNNNHCCATLLTQEFFQNVINSLTIQMKLKHKTFDIKGKTTKFFTASYDVVEGSITQYRKALYNAIDQLLDTMAIKTKTDAEYVYYSVNDEVLYAVPAYSHGNNVWSPHVSILRSDKCNDRSVQQYLELGNCDNLIAHLRRYKNFNLQEDRCQYINVDKCQIRCSTNVTIIPGFSF